MGMEESGREEHVDPAVYAEIAARLASSIPARASREERMRAVVEALWESLGDGGVSWVGFYLPAPDAESLLLGPRRDKPACSPIGMHGVCGRSFRERRPLVVSDVRDLGPAYIACDPADRSEVAVPVLEAGGACWAVLDLDSHRAGFFRPEDAQGLQRVLAAGFASP